MTGYRNGSEDVDTSEWHRPAADGVPTADHGGADHAPTEVSDAYVEETSYAPGTPWSPPTLQGPTIVSVDAVDVATSFHAEAPPTDRRRS